MRLDSSYNVIWCKRYQIDNSELIQVAEKIEMVNGLIIVSFVNDFNHIGGTVPSDTTESIIYGIIDPQNGDLLAANRIDLPDRNEIYQFTVSPDSTLHIVARSNSYDDEIPAEWGLLTISDKLDGFSPICLPVTPLDLMVDDLIIERNTITLTVEDYPPVEQFEIGWIWANEIDVLPICPSDSSQNLQTHLVYSSEPCMPPADSTTLTLRLCNTGYSPHPTGVPYTLYDNNPTQGSVNVLLSDTLVYTLPPTVCRNFEVTVPTPTTGRVAVAINDNGSQTTPYLPAAAFVHFSDEDLTDNVFVLDLPTDAGSVQTNIDTLLCAGDTLFVDGIAFPPGTSDTLHYQTLAGCDSTVIVQTTAAPIYAQTDTLQLCFGETTELFGQLIDTVGTYVQTVASINGCDSTQTYVVRLADSLFVETLVQAATGEQNNGAILTQNPAGNYQYAWSNGGTGAFQDELAPGDYQLTLTDVENGCQRVYTFTVERLTSTDNATPLLWTARLQPQPSPRGGTTELLLTAATPVNLTLDLLDAAGRTLRPARTIRVTQDRTVALTAPPTTGLYFLRLSTAAGERQTMRWVVE